MSSDLSPFHIGNKYFISWGRQPSDTIKLKPSTLNTAQRLVVEKMGFLYFATRVQLAKILNPGNIRRGKKNVSFLLDKGYLVEHTMTGKENNKLLPIYSLSNPARKLLGYPKFQKALTVEVLSKLMVSQFYSRFYEVDPATQMDASHVPFDALCTVRGMQFQIATLRDKGQREKVLNQIRFGDNKEKVLIVASQLTEANAFLDIKETHLFRITTDHNLLKEDLSVSFSYVENGELKSELIPPFKSRPKLIQEPIQPVSNPAAERLLSTLN